MTLTRSAPYLACTIFILLLSQLLPKARAGTLVVKAKKDGHGVIALTSSRCLIVTPLHVVETREGTRSPESLITVIGPGLERGEAELTRASLEDVAVYEVNEPTTLCKTPKFPFDGEIEELLEAYDTGAIRHLTETGGQARIRVEISHWTAQFIEATPIARPKSVTEGDSGSALVVGNNKFIGIVLSVEDDRIKAIRKDYLVKLLTPILDQPEDSEENIFFDAQIRQLHRERYVTDFLTLELLETSHGSNPPYIEFTIRDYSSTRASFVSNVHCVQGDLCRVVLDSGAYRVEFSQVTETDANFIITPE